MNYYMLYGKTRAMLQNVLYYYEYYNGKMANYINFSLIIKLFYCIAASV